MSLSSDPDDGDAFARDRARRAARLTASIGVGLALAAVAYVGAWVYVALELREGIAGWTQARRADGFEIRYGTVTLGGFPGAIRATLAAPEVDAIGTGGKWRADAAAVEFAPWSPERLRVRILGTQSLTVGDGPGGRPETWEGQAGKFVVEIAQAGNRVRSISVATSGAVFRNALSGAEAGAADAVLTVALPARPPADHREENFSLIANAADARLPAPPVPGLGRTLSRLALEARFKGPFDVRLFGPLGARIETGRLRARTEALAAWRDGGGTIEAKRLDATLGPLSLSADGTLALDGAMQPVGAFTARLEGFLEAIDALRDSGLVRGRDAVTAKVLLAALARRDNAGKLSLSAPLTAQDRRLHIGPVPLLTLPEVAW